MRLREISPANYASNVLPLTASLWAGRRTFDEYVAQTLGLAQSAYGRRHYRTMGLYDGRRLVASFKRYERNLHEGPRRLNAIGFGAVFTPAEYRGRGYASYMLASALDGARSDAYDLAYLFSDIRPHFYTSLGFRVLPSRELTLRADALSAQRLQIAPLTPDDRAGVRRCFEQRELARRAGFLRSPSFWEWLTMRMRYGSGLRSGDATNLAVRRGRSLRAYVLGARVPQRDAYVLDEYGFLDDAAAATIPALLRAAAGDLRRIVGWLPPDGARQALPKGTTRTRKSAVFMMAPLSINGERLIGMASERFNADFCWATDHV
jgi:GNAT superfamily N-acetyltransferase